jgi:hypothetical protein
MSEDEALLDSGFDAHKSYGFGQAFLATSKKESARNQSNENRTLKRYKK